MRLDSVTAIADHLRAQGNTVDHSEDKLIAVAPIGARLSSVELRWQTKTGSLHVFEILPLPIPLSALTAVTAAIMTANAQLGIPGFQLRNSPAGWRVVFLACAFLDEDNTVSPRVVDETLRAVRVNASAYLPQFAARVAETGKPTDSLQLTRRNPQLSSDEQAALRDAVTRALPTFAPRLHQALLVEIEQPFFRATRILELTSPLPTPARTVYVARSLDGTLHVLSGHPAAIRAMSAADPAVVAHGEAALVLANVISVWLVDELGELRVSTFSDIPFSEGADITALRTSFAERITPPAFTVVDGGFELHYFCVAHSQLVERRIRIAGTVSVTTDVHAELPVPPGRVWGMVEGRLVPTG